MKTSTQQGRPPLLFLFSAVLVAIGVGVAIVRLINGLGTTTCLSDGYHWGLWIVYDVFFVPFSAGAFMILAITHIYRRKEYHALARPVVLAGFLGEVMIIAVLVMDLGRWHQFYNVLIPWYWNIHSFMFQVSICLTIYMAVMALEMAPVVLERLSWQRPLRLIRMATVLIAGLGIVLSCLHQSSLGSLFLLIPYKLHPLWWTPLLPLLFFTSAVFAGLSMAILVVAICVRAFKRSLDLSLLSKLARAVSLLLAFYLVLKLVDLTIAGELTMVFSEGWLSVLFLTEILIGVILPMVLFGMRRVRESSAGLILGSASVLLGVALNRTNVALLAQTAPSGATYFPHWMELVIVAAAVAAGVLLFILAVRFLPILPKQGRKLAGPAWSRRSLVLTGGGLSLLTILVVLLLQPLYQAQASKMQVTLPATPTLATGALLRAENCQACHLDAQALASAGAKGDELVQLTISTEPDKNPHGRLACTTCHYGDAAAEDAADAHADVVTDPSAGDAGLCLACHRDLPEEFPQDRLRTPHDAATHGQLEGVTCSDCHGGVGHGFDPMSGQIICPMSVCLDCHQSRQLDSELSDCVTCHMGPHDPGAAIACSDCHQSTETWKQVGMDGHPVELSGQHAQVACFACHGADLDLTSRKSCADCHDVPEQPHYGSACEDCHTLAGFGDARLPAELHPIPLIGAHGAAPCQGCHADGQQAPAYVCSDCHQRPEGHLAGECSWCHTPGGWAQSMAFVVSLSPQISHGQEGHEGCLMCHSLDGQIQPAPSNHGNYDNGQCILCHKSGE